MKHTDEQCFERVMRRGDEYKNAKKRRRKIIMTALPATICLLLILFALPPLMNMGERSFSGGQYDTLNGTTPYPGGSNAPPPGITDIPDEVTENNPNGSITTGGISDSETDNANGNDPGAGFDITDEQPGVDPGDTLTYTSLSELRSALSDDPDGTTAEITGSDALITFLERRKAENSLIVPLFDGNPAVIRDKEGYSGITVFGSELYGMPWLWYQCLAENAGYTVKFMYTDGVFSESELSAMNVSRLIKKLAPGAPNTDNYTNFQNYKAVYLKEYLIGAKKVNALVYELNDSEQMSLRFMYGTILTVISADAELLSEDFLSRLGFGFISLDGLE